MESGLTWAVITGIICIATFFVGRTSAAKNDGERWGTLTADIRHMKDDISDIKVSLEKNTRDTKESIRRIHERIDEHLRREHSMSVPPRSDT